MLGSIILGDESGVAVEIDEMGISLEVMVGTKNPGNHRLGDINVVDSASR